MESQTRARTDDVQGPVLDAGWDDDALADADMFLGGPGIDTADYSGAPAGVGVDLTTAGPQDTGGAGIDTLCGVTSVIGTTHNDTFAFSEARPGAIYTVDGVAGANTIDLRRHARADVAVDLDEQMLTINLGAGDVATIYYQYVQRLYFSDATPSDAPIAIVDSDRDVVQGGVGELRAVIAGGDCLEPTYRWTQVGGPPAVIHHPDAPESTFVAPPAGDRLVFQLNITDGDAKVAAEVTVLVRPNGPGRRTP